MERWRFDKFIFILPVQRSNTLRDIRGSGCYRLWLLGIFVSVFLSLCLGKRLCKGPFFSTCNLLFGLASFASIWRDYIWSLSGCQLLSGLTRTGPNSYLCCVMVITFRPLQSIASEYSCSKRWKDFQMESFPPGPKTNLASKLSTLPLHFKSVIWVLSGPP